MVACPARFTHEPGRGFSRGVTLHLTGEKKTKRTDELLGQEDEEGEVAAGESKRPVLMISGVGKRDDSLVSAEGKQKDPRNQERGPPH
jgi:hypothetical protein